MADQPLLDDSLMKFSEISVIADERRNNGGSPRNPPNSARAGWSVSSISNSQGNDSRNFDEEKSNNSPKSWQSRNRMSANSSEPNVPIRSNGSNNELEFSKALEEYFMAEMNKKLA